MANTFVTDVEAAQHLHITPEEVQELIANHELQAYRNPPGRPPGYRITTDVFVAYLKKKNWSLGQWGTTAILVAVSDGIVLGLNEAAMEAPFVAIATETLFDLGLAIGLMKPDCIIFNFEMGERIATHTAEEIRDYPLFAKTVLMAMIQEPGAPLPEGLFEKILLPGFSLVELISEIHTQVERKKYS